MNARWTAAVAVSAVCCLAVTCRGASGAEGGSAPGDGSPVNPAVCSPEADPLLGPSCLRWVKSLHDKEAIRADAYARDTRLDELARKPESRGLAGDLLAGKLGFRKIVVVQRQRVRCSHVYTYHNEGFRPGGGLFLFTPGGDGGRLEKLVDSPEGQILSADLSFDGREILFSWRRSESDFYQVYRINVDGTGLKQLTAHPSYNYDACWLPDGGIAFVSTRDPQVAYCWVSVVGVLHRMDRDGGNVRRLSANYVNDFTPSVTADGKIIYTRWEYVDRSVSVIQGLWTINPDGTQLRVFYGNRVLNPSTFIEAQPIPGTTKVLCTLTSHDGELGGAVGIVDPARGNNAQASIRNLTPEIDIGRVESTGIGYGPRGPYERPFPIDEELFLVSRYGTILLRDYEGTRCVEVLEPRDGLGFYSPQPLRPRMGRPVVPSDLPSEAGPWATLYLQDVYRGLEPHVKRGEVKRLCVVQEVPKPEPARFWNHSEFGPQSPVVSCGATFAPKKVWGFVPVAEDGSAYFQVPAGVPVYFMALDAEGRAVQRMRSFAHLMPGEVQGCVGCHEPRRETAAVSALPKTLDGEPLELRTPEWGLAGFSYPHVVQPVLDRHCVECHQPRDAAGGLDLSGDKTDYFNVSYEHLAREGGRANPYTKWICTLDGQDRNILEITPKVWGSPASKLADVIVSGHPDEQGRPRVKMDRASRQRVLTWIDLNVPYYATSVSQSHDRPGCRRVYPPGLDWLLGEVAKRRCVSCHSKNGRPDIPRKRWVRVTNPHLNDFLLAPLAKRAGGTERCGRAVFADTDDPDYQAILKTFDAAEELLTSPPRADLEEPRG